MSTDQIRHINLEFPYREEIRRFAIELNLDEYSHRSMWNHFNEGKLYEPETSRLLIGLLEPGDSFIDVGGHIGYFSLLAAATTIATNGADHPPGRRRGRNEGTTRA